MPTDMPDFDAKLTSPPEETKTQRTIRIALHDEEVFEIEELAENTYAALHKETMTEQEAWNVLQDNLQKRRAEWIARELKKYDDYAAKSKLLREANNRAFLEPKGDINV